MKRIKKNRNINALKRKMETKIRKYRSCYGKLEFLIEGRNISKIGIELS